MFVCHPRFETQARERWRMLWFFLDSVAVNFSLKVWGVCCIFLIFKTASSYAFILRCLFYSCTHPSFRDGLSSSDSKSGLSYWYITVRILNSRFRHQSSKFIHQVWRPSWSHALLTEGNISNKLYLQGLGFKEDPWRNGSASDSRSEGCVFESRRVQIPWTVLSF